jgi:DNA primase
MRELLDARADTEETIWQLALARHGSGTAEALAALETELKDRAARVKDETFRQALFRAFKDRIYNLRGEQFAARRQRQKTERLRGQKVHARLSPELRSRLGQGGGTGPGGAAREAQLVVSLIHHPQLFGRFESEMMDLQIADPDLSRLWSRVVHLLIEQPDLDSGGLRNQLSGCSELEATYQRWSKDPLVKIVGFVKQDAAEEVAEDGWRDAYLIDRQQKVLSQEISEAGAEAHLDQGRERLWLNSVRLSLGAHHERDRGSGG